MRKHGETNNFYEEYYKASYIIAELLAKSKSRTLWQSH